MSLSFAAIEIFSSEKFTLVKVQSSKCHYRVAVEGSCARVQGPGVDDFEVDFEDFAERFGVMSPEALALFAVALFEEGNA